MSYPVEKPPKPPMRMGTGWLQNSVKRTLEWAIKPDDVVIELGSWTGKSARFIVEQLNVKRLYCVDTWEGSVEHKADPKYAKQLPYIKNEFIRNTWHIRDRIEIVQATTIHGMQLLHSNGVEPHVIYVDASHEPEDVERDVSTAIELWPRVKLVGDDAFWPGLMKAVGRAIDDSRTLERNEAGWYSLPILTPESF